MSDRYSRNDNSSFIGIPVFPYDALYPAFLITVCFAQKDRERTKIRPIPGFKYVNLWHQGKENESGAILVC